MRTMIGMAFAALMAAGSVTPALSQKDAGHGKDYRTFHADGKTDYGNIQDSYTSDLVMYLAGNQLTRVQYSIVCLLLQIMLLMISVLQSFMLAVL